MSEIIGRRMITREFTYTTIKSAKMEMRDGTPVAIALPDERVFGNIKMARAQREIDKIYKGENATVLEVQHDRVAYELEVEKFLEVARLKEQTDE